MGNAEYMGNVIIYFNNYFVVGCEKI